MGNSDFSDCFTQKSFFLGSTNVFDVFEVYPLLFVHFRPVFQNLLGKMVVKNDNKSPNGVFDFSDFETFPSRDLTAREMLL